MSTSLNPLRAYRAKAGISLDGLADAIKKAGAKRPSKAKLSRIETGRQQLPIELIPFAVKATGLSERELRPDLAAVFGETEAATE